jgi:hypothetical protein
MATKWTLTIDCSSPAVLAAFWAVALGYVESSPPEGFASWEEWLGRVHLDVQVGGGRGEPLAVRWPRVTAAVERLTAAGATVLGEYALDDGTPDHVVMADPEGHEFCVV